VLLWSSRFPELSDELPAPHSMQSRTVWFAVPVQLVVKVKDESSAAPLRMETFP
jgi:hypothetical protein